MTEPLILVVDDEPNVVRLCQRFLEKADFRVVTATTSHQALGILARQAVDLVLADIRMPGLDGFQMLALARTHQPDLAAVIMTGYGTIETAIKALHQGADGLILKPFSGADLIHTVKRALQESQRKLDTLKLRALRPLFEIADKMFAETDRVRLQDLIVDSIYQQLHCTLVILYEPSAGQPEVVASHGSTYDFEICFRDENKLARVVRGEVPYLVNREGQGDEWIQRMMVECKLSTLMCIPVMTHAGSVLVAMRAEGEPYFRDIDMEMFVILARQAGLALENAQLYDELRASIHQIEKSRYALSQAEKIAAAGRLTASIAHEINNPLQSLHNCLHLASRKELSTTERQKYLQMAQSELQRLMNTVQRMLDFYRPGARDRQLIDLNEIIQRVLVLMESQLVRNRVAVVTQLDTGLPMVTAVANQIQQVLINLILNAMEAMPDGGELFITTQQNGSDEADGHVVVLIEDTGPGISETEAENLFEPFISTKEQGTGLGLSVSYGIISAHGGNLSLVRGKGTGACFRITLPKENIQ